MSFQISGLPLAQFVPLFSMSDVDLAEQHIVRRTADSKPGFPCRVSLEDAEPGESVLLLNYEHQPASSPYRSSYAIYVRENATEARLEVGQAPELLRSRLLSIRAFDERGFVVGAEVGEGRQLEQSVQRLFANPAAAYLHIHYAKFGCYAARVDRA